MEKIKVKPNEEVVEMGKDNDGTYKQVAIMKINPQMNQHISPHIPRQSRMPIFYQFVDGFVEGVGALEYMMKMLRRLR